MFYWRTAAIVLLLTLIFVLPSLAGGRKASRGPSPTPVVNPLDRIAFAVDGAESSHGVDQAMWRADATGPQGPMQVSEAAAIDVGGGDRFDLDRNREIGRAYLSQLYRRYGDWPDAIAAYNWGIGNLNAWVKAGRPADRLVPGVTAYLGRVMHDSGLCEKSSPKAPQQSASTPESPCDSLGSWSGLVGNGHFPPDPGAAHFQSQLDRALRLAMEHAR